MLSLRRASDGRVMPTRKTNTQWMVILYEDAELSMSFYIDIIHGFRSNSTWAWLLCIDDDQNKLIGTKGFRKAWTKEMIGPQTATTMAQLPLEYPDIMAFSLSKGATARHIQVIWTIIPQWHHIQQYYFTSVNAGAGLLSINIIALYFQRFLIKLPRYS